MERQGVHVGPPGFLAAAAVVLVEVRRQLRHHVRLEEGHDVHRLAQVLFEAVHDLGHEERVPAEGEEVVVGAHLVETEHLGPDARHQLLGGGAGGHVVARLGPPTFGDRQGGPVDLAVGVERERVEGHDREGTMWSGNRSRSWARSWEASTASPSPTT